MSESIQEWLRERKGRRLRPEEKWQFRAMVHEQHLESLGETVVHSFVLEELIQPLVKVLHLRNKAPSSLTVEAALVWLRVRDDARRGIAESAPKETYRLYERYAQEVSDARLVWEGLIAEAESVLGAIPSDVVSKAQKLLASRKLGGEEQAETARVGSQRVMRAPSGGHPLGQADERLELFQKVASDLGQSSVARPFSRLVDSLHDRYSEAGAL